MTDRLALDSRNNSNNNNAAMYSINMQMWTHRSSLRIEIRRSHAVH